MCLTYFKLQNLLLCHLIEKINDKHVLPPSTYISFGFKLNVSSTSSSFLCFTAKQLKTHRANSIRGMYPSQVLVPFTNRRDTNTKVTHDF